jgi:hypothetical protein
MSHMRAAFVLLLGSLGPMVWGAAHAAGTAGLTVVPPPSEFACLESQASRKVPVYPEQQALLKQGAVVRIQITFDRTGGSPRTEVAFNSGDVSFAEAVKSFASTYRLPCALPDGPPLLATQEFQFVPGDGRKVIFGNARQLVDETRIFSCLQKPAGLPTYPRKFFSSEQPEGTVVLQMKFLDATSPPQTKVLFDGGSAALARSASDYVSEYRLPCLTKADLPLEATQSFAFVIEGSKRYALKDVTLRQFLGFADALDRRVRFDFSTMSCPFDVQFVLFQPHATNRVAEIERADPNRREFLEWLKGLSLRLPKEAGRHVIGQEMVVSVPCIVLDLT